jgi:hypothetical protein
VFYKYTSDAINCTQIIGHNAEFEIRRSSDNVLILSINVLSTASGAPALTGQSIPVGTYNVIKIILDNQGDPQSRQVATNQTAFCGNTFVIIGGEGSGCNCSRNTDGIPCTDCGCIEFACEQAAPCSICPSNNPFC